MLQFTHLFGQPLVECLGWSLVHFLWQGLVLANVLLLLLLTFRRRSANVRYVAACGALLTMAVCPLATFAWLWVHLDARHETAGTTVEAWLDASAEPVDHFPSADLTGDHPLAMPPSQIGEPAEAVQIARRERIHVPAPTESSFSTLYQKLERAIPWVVLAWLVGVVTCSLRLSLGWIRLRRVKSAGSQAAFRWQELAGSVAQRLRLSKPVRFLESTLVEVPTVVGWLRPIVLLPAAALTGLTPGQLEALLAHELAHIRRNDYLVNLLQTLIETLLFYHPAVWWVSARMRQEREHCCDDLAIRLCGDRIEYVRALASLEELRATAPGLAVAAGDGSLLKRVRRLIGSPETKPGGLQVSLVTLLAVLLIGTMFVAPFVLPADTTADPSQNQQPAATSDDESGETTLLIANWGAVLDEPVVQQLRKLSAGDVKSQDGASTWLVNADQARGVVCAARDQKPFVMVSTSVEWLAPDRGKRAGFCTVSGIHEASSSPCSVTCQSTADANVAGSEVSLNLRLDFTGQGTRGGRQFDLKERLSTSAKIASGQAFLVAVDLAPVHDWRYLDWRMRYVVVFEAVCVPTARWADYQRLTVCNWWLRQTHASVAKLFRQAEAWQRRAAARPQTMLDAWTRTLSHGGKVNLVAIGRPGQDPFRWWNAEGQPYPFDWRKWGSSLEQHELVAMLRIWEPASSFAGYNADRSQRADSQSRLGVASYPDDWPTTPGSQLVVVPIEQVTAHGQPEVSVGFGAGPWLASQDLALRQEMSLEGQALFLDDRDPSPSYYRQETFARAVLSWSFLPDREVRLFGVDKAGREHASDWPPEVRSNRLPLPRRTESVNESFKPLPRSELDHFVVKTRPRHWVAFSGFALQPAGETWGPVQITVRGTDADQIAFVRAAVRGVPRTPGDFARQFADSLRAAIATRHAPFLSEELLDKVRGDFQSFVAEHHPATLTAEQQQAILDSTTKFVALSVGDYLSFPDALENLKQRLRQAFDRRPLTEEQQRRLAEQREWIREFIRQLPLEPGAWLRLHAEALVGFEELLDDPLWPLLKEPLSDEQFGVFQQKLKERQDLKIHFIVWHIGAALAQTLWPQGNWSTSDGNIWFTFDRAQRGEQPRLPALDAEGQVCVLDVPTLRIEYPPGIGPLTRDQIETLLKGKEAEHGNAVGDLGYFQKGDLLAGFRGARLALLDTNDWYTADQLSERELRRRIDTGGADTIALAKHRPPGHGFANPDAPFIAVCTGSGRLAVLTVQAFDPTGVTIHIRTRSVNQGGTGVGADGGSVSNPPDAAAISSLRELLAKPPDAAKGLTWTQAERESVFNAILDLVRNEDPTLSSPALAEISVIAGEYLPKYQRFPELFALALDVLDATPKYRSRGGPLDHRNTPAAGRPIARRHAANCPA